MLTYYYKLDIHIDPSPPPPPPPPPATAATTGDHFFSIKAIYVDLSTPSPTGLGPLLVSALAVVPQSVFFTLSPAILTVIFSKHGVALPDNALRSFAPAMSRFAAFFASNPNNKAVLPIEVSVFRLDPLEAALRESEGDATTSCNVAETSQPGIVLLVEEDGSEDQQCCICMEDMVSDVVRTPCSHEFHHDCIVRWLHTGPSCPLCRESYA